MKYYYIDVDARTGEPRIYKLKAYGYRRKNKKDQVFCYVDNKLQWIFANVVKST
jgi:hypothetical protein